jgi:hypothetical protein
VKLPQYTGPGFPGDPSKRADTNDLLRDVYRADLETAVRRTRRDLERRGMHATDGEIMKTVLDNYDAGNVDELPNYTRAAQTVMDMERNR